MTKQLIGFCGYRCDLCPAYTKNINKSADRTMIRNGWKIFFDLDVPEDRLLCVGCFDSGKHLDKNCPVRPCAQNKQVETCSWCDLFETCETLRLRADVLDVVKKNLLIEFHMNNMICFFVPMKDERNYDNKKGREYDL